MDLGLLFVDIFAVRKEKDKPWCTAKCDKSHCGNYCVLSIIHGRALALVAQFLGRVDSCLHTFP